MPTPKNILVICWDFPPNNAIGGRRWAKISKSLLKLGHTVSVIANSPIKRQKKLAWISDKEMSKINFYGCEEFFLVRWLNDYESPFKFFRIHFSRFLLNIFVNGTIFDKTIGLEKKIFQLAVKVIDEQKIDTVFVTGAPFNLVFYTSRLKQKFPGVTLVADYRDPWINAQNYGMQSLSPANKQAELKKQNYVFENVDYITAPNSFLLDEIKQTFTGSNRIRAKFITLPHAFDPDDVFYKKSLEPKDKIKIVYGGTLYMGLDKYLEFFNASVSHIKRNSLRKLLEISFYTKENNKEILFKDNRDIVKFFPSIGETIFEEINTCDFILIFLSEHNKNYVTSKFFEFLPYNKPYIYIGPEGFVSNKILNDNLGYVLKNEEDLSNLLAGNLAPIDSKKNLNSYSFDQTVLDFLKTL